MDLVVGGNSVCCFIIFVIFIGLGRAYRLGGALEVIIWEGKPKRDGTIFKNFNLAIVEGLDWMK